MTKKTYLHLHTTVLVFIVSFTYRLTKFEYVFSQDYKNATRTTTEKQGYVRARFSEIIGQNQWININDDEKYISDTLLWKQRSILRKILTNDKCVLNYRSDKRYLGNNKDHYVLIANCFELTLTHIHLWRMMHESSYF